MGITLRVSKQAKSFLDFVQLFIAIPRFRAERQWLVVDIERLVEGRKLCRN